MIPYAADGTGLDKLGPLNGPNKLFGRQRPAANVG